MVDIAALLNPTPQAKPGEAVIPQAAPGSEGTPGIAGFSDLLNLLSIALPTEAGAPSAVPAGNVSPAKPASAAGTALPEGGKPLPVALPGALPKSLPLRLPLGETPPIAEPAEAGHDSAPEAAEDRPVTSDTLQPNAVVLAPLVLPLPTPLPAPVDTAAPRPAGPPAAARPPIVPVRTVPAQSGQPTPATITPEPQARPLVVMPSGAAVQAAVALNEAAAPVPPQVKLRPVSRQPAREGEVLNALPTAVALATDRPRPVPAMAAIAAAADPLAAPVLPAATPAMSQDPAPAALNAAPRAEAPQDFAALVDRLVQAREMAAPAVVHAALRHAEFGQVSLRFEQDDAGLSVSMASPDPAFARAAQAAIPAASAAAQADTNTSGSARQETPQGSAPGFAANTATGQSPQQGRGGEQARGAADQRIAGQPARRDDAAEDTPGSGIFA